jgi:nicotinate-nucleotide pyrophosphorylase (carboxylating)
LIKENHLKFNSDIQEAIKLIKKKKTFWEIEVENDQELLWAVSFNPDVIMLDNFSPQQILKNKKILTKYKNIIWEASGGITIDNIVNYKKTGVDIISLGSLTHSAKSLDISLDIV